MLSATFLPPTAPPRARYTQQNFQASRVKVIRRDPANEWGREHQQMVQVSAVDFSNDMVSALRRSATMSHIAHYNCSSGHYFDTFQAAAKVIIFCAQNYSPQLEALAMTL